MRGRTLRAVDVVAEALERIGRADPVLCAFLDVWPGEALRRAREVDARVAAGEGLPLAGVPVAVKGRYGLRAAGPLLAAGCVAVGATAVPGPGTPWQTWGLGAHGRTVNPWRADRTPADEPPGVRDWRHPASWPVRPRTRRPGGGRCGRPARTGRPRTSRSGPSGPPASASPGPTRSR